MKSESKCLQRCMIDSVETVAAHNPINSKCASTAVATLCNMHQRTIPETQVEIFLPKWLSSADVEMNCELQHGIIEWAVRVSDGPEVVTPGVLICLAQVVGGHDVCQGSGLREHVLTEVQARQHEEALLNATRQHLLRHELLPPARQQNAVG